MEDTSHGDLEVHKDKHVEAVGMVVQDMLKEDMVVQGMLEEGGMEAQRMMQDTDTLKESELMDQEALGMLTLGLGMMDRLWLETSMQDLCRKVLMLVEVQNMAGREVGMMRNKVGLKDSLLLVYCLVDSALSV